MKLNFACEEAPKDLRDKLVVSVGLRSKNFFQDEKIVMGVFVLLGLEKELREVKKVLTIGNRDFVNTFAKCIEIELAVLSHFCHISIVRKECYQFLSFLFSSCHKLGSLNLVG